MLASISLSAFCEMIPPAAALLSPAVTLMDLAACGAAGVATAAPAAGVLGPVPAAAAAGAGAYGDGASTRRLTCSHTLRSFSSDRSCIQKRYLVPVWNSSTKTRPVVHCGTGLKTTSPGKRMSSYGMR